jgi:uncharacterized protein
VTTIYFDSSALTKLLLQEDGSRVSLDLWNAADAAASSRLSYPEVRAALAAARRSQRVDADRYVAATAEWEQLWSEIRVVEPAVEVLHAAGDLAESQALRGYDAVHLASALRLAEHEVIMVAWDKRLRSAALCLGLVTAPASDPGGGTG